LPARHCELNGPKRVSFVATLQGRGHGEAVEHAHEMQRLALAGLPRILAEPDADPFAVPFGGVVSDLVDPLRRRAAVPVAMRMGNIWSPHGQVEQTCNRC
jgi:hypothetical protein